MTPSDKKNSDREFVKNFIRLIAEVKGQDPLTVSREMLRMAKERSQQSHEKPDK